MTDAMEDHLFDFRDGSVRDLSRLLELQTRLFLPFELAVYHTSPAWMTAERVLDMGTGEGTYLSRIAERFPSKSYFGVDLVPSLVELARERYGQLENISFEQRDILDVQSVVDFVIMHVLLQHVPDVAKVLDKCAEVTRPGGGALIVDGLDALLRYEPAFDGMTLLFREIARARAEAGLDHDVMDHLPEVVERHPGWKLAMARDFLIPSTVPGNWEVFGEMDLRIIDYLQGYGRLDYDFDSLRRDWAAWRSRPSAYCQVGIRVLSLERI